MDQLKRDDQFNWLGLDGPDNLWILKPACMNRGRGIRVVKDLHEILRHAKYNTQNLPAAAVNKGPYASPNAGSHVPNTGSNNNNNEKWIIQKYIEQPMIIADRKFDIRQWVVVTSWTPIRAWFYQDA